MENSREIRIGTRTGRRTIDNILNAFLENEDARIVLRSVGGAMSNAIIVSEIVRRRSAGLHSILHLDRAVFAGDESSAEEGVEHQADRKVPMMIITLTKKPTEEDLSAVGHQDPVDPSRLRNRADDFVGGIVPRGGVEPITEIIQQGLQDRLQGLQGQPGAQGGQGAQGAQGRAGVRAGGSPGTNVVTTVLPATGAIGGRRRGRFGRGRGGNLPQAAGVTA